MTYQRPDQQRTTTPILARIVKCLFVAKRWNMFFHRFVYRKSQERPPKTTSMSMTRPIERRSRSLVGFRFAMIGVILASLCVIPLTMQSNKINIGYKSCADVFLSPSPSVRGGVFSGSSGHVFSGEVVRRFEGPLKVKAASGNAHKKSSDLPLFPSSIVPNPPVCDAWAVVTTINGPTDSVKSVAALKGWCMVVVGDNKTPSDYLSDVDLKADADNKIVYLSADQQRKITHQFVQTIPYNSFARKTVGFLFAIQQGAKVIYDFDDDNVLLEHMAPLAPAERGIKGNNILLRYTDDDATESGPNSRHGHSFNPLRFMNPSEPHIWPRGFPLNDIMSQRNDTTISFGSIPFSSVGVIQAVCNEDPDFDAIYRLTRKLPVTFTESPKEAHRLLVPSGKFAPYNAQATTHFYDAFWGLLLPWTVPGRVTDIWRSYFTQRIFQDLGLFLVYEPALVRHDRSPHNYLGDLRAEDDLYMKTPALLDFLANWDVAEEDLPTRIELLAVALYERGYLEIDDVYGMQGWLLALKDLGYKFPSTKKENKTLRATPELNQEDQPFLVSPRFNVGKNGERYEEYLHANNKAGTFEAFKEWKSNLQISIRPSKEPILKIILMTKNDWPFIKQWILYHGHLVGFENLYIIDGSSDKKTISFLRYARDHHGANVIFSNVDLYLMKYLLSAVGKAISEASDFVMKMDSDEFLFGLSGSSECNYVFGGNCSISPYSFENALHQALDVSTGDRLYAGASSLGWATHHACEESGGNDRLAEFAVTTPQFAGPYKAITDSRTLAGVDLGGHRNRHVPPFGNVDVNGTDPNGTYTPIGIIHFGGCYGTRFQKARTVLSSHGFFEENISDEDLLKVLLKLEGKTSLSEIENVCGRSPAEWSAVTRIKASSHKFLELLEYLAGCTSAEKLYNIAASGSPNLDFATFLGESVAKCIGVIF